MIQVFKLMLWCLLASVPLFGQAGDFTLRVDVPVVTLDVSVTDATGQPVHGLTAEDFDIYEDGVLQDLRYFGSSTAPYHVYLLFDSSGSTRHKWDFMRRAVAGFADYVKPQDRISIGIFDEDLRTLVGWDSQRDEAVRALDPLMGQRESGRTTEFYRALGHVLDRSFDRILERRAVIVLTDGRDTSLYLDIVRRNRLMTLERDRRFRNLRNKTQENGIPIHFIAVNTDRNLEANTREADEYRNLKLIYKDSSIPNQYLEQVRLRMENLAETSGGQVLFPRTINDVIPLYKQIGQELGNAYSLGYIPPPAEPSEELREIIVKVGSGAYQVRQSRRGYYIQ